MICSRKQCVLIVSKNKKKALVKKIKFDTVKIEIIRTANQWKGLVYWKNENKVEYLTGIKPKSTYEEALRLCKRIKLGKSRFFNSFYDRS